MLLSFIFSFRNEAENIVLITVAFFSGVVLMTNGIMGIYLARIYYEVKGRPRYIVENVVEPPASVPRKQA
jgi:polyisoprenyl-phosphate glycosyltransferase